MEVYDFPVKGFDCILDYIFNWKNTFDRLI